MPRNADNRIRALADVVTIDAWHDAFDGTIREADLHADVVFGTARVGGAGEASPVRFRLSVRRAEVIVIVPDSEPLTIDQRKVSRDSIEVTGTLTETYEKATKGAANATFSASLDVKAPGASIALGGNAETSSASNKKLEVTTVVRLLSVTQSMTEEGHYRWIVEGQTKNKLMGRPWDSDKPRLALIDGRANRKSGIPPTVRVEVRCRREDLVIEGIEPTDSTILELVKNRVGISNNIAAAESYIRDQLAELGLQAENIDDRFGRLTVASVTANPLQKQSS